LERGEIMDSYEKLDEVDKEILELQERLKKLKRCREQIQLGED